MENMEKRRESAINALRLALAAHEDPQGDGEAIHPFITGHGIQSLRFTFRWEEEALDINFSLPYACVLSDEAIQAAEAVETGAAIRMAMLLLHYAANGALLHDGEARLAVWHDGERSGWETTDADGETVEGADDLSTLAARLSADAETNAAMEKMVIIWP